MRERQYYLISLSGGGYRAALFHAGVLRAFHAFGLFREGALERDIIVNSVSGGALPSILWRRYMMSRESYTLEDSWPENALLDLVCSTPILGGEWNWILRGTGVWARQRWEAFLQNWWDKHPLKYWSYGDGGSPIFLIETLEYLSGKIWLYDGRQFAQASREYFKSGIVFLSHECSPMTAVAAATAFPGMFRGYLFKVQGDDHLLKDAGIIDNLGVLPLLELIKRKPNDRSRLGQIASWFLSDAGRPMAVSLRTGVPIFGQTKTVPKLKLSDRLFRLTGDISQPHFAAALTDLLGDYVDVPVVAVGLDQVFRLETPWMLPTHPENWTPAQVKTSLCGMSRELAISIMSAGAQSASFAIMDRKSLAYPNCKQLDSEKVKEFFSALLTERGT